MIPLPRGTVPARSAADSVTPGRDDSGISRERKSKVALCVAGSLPTLGPRLKETGARMDMNSLDDFHSRHDGARLDPRRPQMTYSTVTLFARLRGLSTSQPRRTAIS